MGLQTIGDSNPAESAVEPAASDSPSRKPDHLLAQQTNLGELS